MCVNLLDHGLGVHLPVKVLCHYCKILAIKNGIHYLILHSTAVDCGTLTNPSNGQVNTTGTTLGQTATYSCNPGYNLVGGSTRTCQATGSWSGSVPTCQGMLLMQHFSYQVWYILCNSSFNSCELWHSA